MGRSHAERMEAVAKRALKAQGQSRSSSRPPSDSIRGVGDTRPYIFTPATGKCSPEEYSRKRREAERERLEKEGWKEGWMSPSLLAEDQFSFVFLPNSPTRLFVPPPVLKKCGDLKASAKVRVRVNWEHPRGPRVRELALAV